MEPISIVTVRKFITNRSIAVTYDSLFEIARCLTEIYSSLKFCQPVIFGDFLSDTDEFLSPLLNFCQTLKVTLTVCCSVNVRSHV